MLKSILLSVVFVASTLISAAQTKTKAGTSAGQFLRIPVGARAAALGGAVTSSSVDASSLFWNPASAAEIKNATAMVDYGDWFLDMGHTYIGFVIPTSESGAFGMSVVSMDMGTFEETTMEAPDGTGREFGARSFALGASYAHEMFSGFYFGGTAKFIRETIWNTSAQTVAFDLGTSFVTPFDGLRFGVSVTNAGGRMNLRGNDLLVSVPQQGSGSGDYRPDAYLFTNDFDLPLQMKIGFAWDAINTKGVRWTLLADGTNPSDNTQSLSLATEASLLNDMIVLRAGLPELFAKDRVIKHSAGVGLNLPLDDKLAIQFGYAYQNYTYLNGVNRISLSVGF